MKKQISRDTINKQQNLVRSDRLPFVRVGTALKRLLLSILAWSLLLLQLSPSAFAAGSATLTLSPSSGSYTKSKTLTVTVHENSGSTEVNAIEADLGYDKAKLQFVSIDTSSSAFDLSFIASGGSGSVQIVRAKSSTSVTGDQIVGSVTFKVLAGSGTTSISFRDSSQIVQTNPTQDVWDHDTSGGTYTLKGDTTGGSGGGSGTPGDSGGGSSSSSSSSTTAPVSKKTNHAAPKASVVANGYYVVIKVVDTKGNPLEGATATLEGQSPVSTDNTGTAGFYNIKEGTYNVTTEFKGQTVTEPVTVVKNDSPAAQVFTIVIKQKTSVVEILIWSGIGLLILLALVVVTKKIVKRIHNRRESKFYTQNLPTSPSPTTGSGAGPGHIPSPTLSQSPSTNPSGVVVGVVDNKGLKKPKF